MVDRNEGLKSELRALVGAANLIDSGESLESLSKDFYWYSPVLKRQLEDKLADMAVRPASQDQRRRSSVPTASPRKASSACFARASQTGPPSQ